MNIDFKATNLELTEPLKAYILEKIGGLNKVLKRVEAESGALYAVVEVARTTNHHRKGDIYYAETNLHLPTKTLRAEATADDIRKAIDSVREKLREEIEKYSEKK
ncbi:MAG TPA: ribosome-associated translation inhibitor RaiA [Candidatus Tyrphobacter sp.]|nr:ribosome-associated translation inhibitor RaiA [Candidatus Tyrphobacter sp.]